MVKSTFYHNQTVVDATKRTVWEKKSLSVDFEVNYFATLPLQGERLFQTVATFFAFKVSLE